MQRLHAGSFFIWVLILGVTDANSLEKRSTAYSIETRVIVDSYAVSSWKAILATSDAGAKTALQAYVKSAFHDLNSILGTLSAAGINIDARIVGIEFATGQISASSNGLVDSGKSLTDLRTWLSSKSYSRVDHTMLVTGLDLVRDGSNITAGVANMGQMCDAQNSLSVVEASPSGSVTQVMAHELGHSLNSVHDDGDLKCSAYNYIMKSLQSMGDKTSNQNFRFSSCTVNHFKAFLASGKGNCLTQTTAQKQSSSPLGKLYTPDEMCEMVLGQGSFFSRDRYGVGTRPYGKMCLNLWCQIPGNSMAWAVKPADGFICGTSKRCFLGDCVQDTSGSTESAAASDSCPVGETPQPLIYLNNQTCSQAITSFSGKCYGETARRACCESCETAKTGEEDCEYGDKQPWCLTMDSSSCSANAEQCCSRCKVDDSDPDCPHGDQISACSTMTAPYCYDPNNVALCCASCKAFEKPNLGSDCKYGDKNPGCATMDLSNCAANKGLCCERCA